MSSLAFSCGHIIYFGVVIAPVPTSRYRQCENDPVFPDPVQITGWREPFPRHPSSCGSDSQETCWPSDSRCPVCFLLLVHEEHREHLHTGRYQNHQRHWKIQKWDTSQPQRRPFRFARWKFLKRDPSNSTSYPRSSGRAEQKYIAISDHWYPKRFGCALVWHQACLVAPGCAFCPSPMHARGLQW